MHEKVGKSRNTVFFKWLVAPEGRKEGSLKRQVRSHVVRWEMKSCTPLWREAHFQVVHFQVKMYKTPQLRSAFRSCDVEYAPCQKWAKREGFVACPKFSRGRRSARDMFIRAVEVRALISWEELHFGASDLRVCWDDFARQVQHFVWLGITFSWQAQYFRQVEWKNRKTHWYEAVSFALNFPLLKEVLQNCVVFDVVTVEKIRKSRRIVSFLLLSTSKIGEVSQNFCVNDVVKF